MVRLTPEILSKIPRERDVISFSVIVDALGRGLLIKLRLRNGKDDILFIPTEIIFKIRDGIIKVFDDVGYSEPQDISEFLNNQPKIEKKDSENIQNMFVKACEMHAQIDHIYLGFQINQKKYKVLRLDLSICFHFVARIQKLEDNLSLIDPSRTHPGTYTKQ